MIWNCFNISFKTGETNFNKTVWPMSMGNTFLLPGTTSLQLAVKQPLVLRNENTVSNFKSKNPFKKTRYNTFRTSIQMCLSSSLKTSEKVVQDLFNCFVHQEQSKGSDCGQLSSKYPKLDFSLLSNWDEHSFNYIALYNTLQHYKCFAVSQRKEEIKITWTEFKAKVSICN